MSSPLGQKSVTKSVARHIMSAQWPSAFYKEQIPPETNNVQLQFQDIQQCIKTWSLTWRSNPLKPNTYTATHFEDLAAGIKREAEIGFELNKNLLAHVLVFDDYVHMSIAKGHEHNSRNAKMATYGEGQAEKTREADEDGEQQEEDPAQKQEAADINAGLLLPEDGIHFRDRRPWYIEPGLPVPTDYRWATGDRENTLPHIVRCICRYVLNTIEDKDGMHTSFNTMSNSRVIISGHMLQPEDLREIGAIYPSRTLAIKGWAKTKGQTRDPLLSSADFWNECGYGHPDTILYTPICVEFGENQFNKTMRIAYFVSDLRHTVGEADFAIFALHHTISRWLFELNYPLATTPFPLLSFNILSVDTDLILYGGCYLDNWRRNRGYNDVKKLPQIWMRAKPFLGWVFGNKRTPYPAECEWIDISHLYDLVQIQGKFTAGVPVASVGAALYTRTVKSQQPQVQDTDVVVYLTEATPTKRKDKESGGGSNKKKKVDVVELDDFPDTVTKTKAAAAAPPKKPFRGMMNSIDELDVDDELPSVAQLKTTTSSATKSRKRKATDTAADDGSKPAKAPRKKAVVLSEEYELLGKWSSNFLNYTTNRWLNIVAAFLMCGGDYTSGFYPFNHRRAFEAYRRNSKFVKDLVQVRQLAVKPPQLEPMFTGLEPCIIGRDYLLVNGDAFLNMVCVSVAESKARSAVIKEFRDCPYNYMYQDMVRATARLKAQNQMPTQDEILVRLKQLNFVFYMISQVGNGRTLLDPEDIESFGYTKVDPALPLSRTNILRLLE